MKMFDSGTNMDNRMIRHISHDPNQLLWTDPEYLQSDPDADYIFTSPDDERMSDSLPNNKGIFGIVILCGFMYIICNIRVKQFPI